MFNIQFGGSNSAQVFVAKFYTTESREENTFNSLYCNKENLEELKQFLLDVRTMSDEDFRDVINLITTAE